MIRDAVRGKLVPEYDPDDIVVKHLWDDHYRVNVVRDRRIVRSFFVTLRGDDVLLSQG